MSLDPSVSYTVPRAGYIHTHEMEIKKSRFLTYLTRVTSDDDARAFIESIRAAHRDARHHCTAFLVGPGRETGRSSDDGEPSGTAGMPMMQALTGYKSPAQRDLEQDGDLSDICAVVVRWFGGVKLGAGGLVRAYSTAVSEALETAVLMRRTRSRELRVELPHADAGRIEDEVRNAGYAVQPTQYLGHAAVLTVLVADTEAEIRNGINDITAITSGAQIPLQGESAWHDLPLP